MAFDSHRTRPVLDNDRDIEYAITQLRRVTTDPTGICRLLVENFAVDLDLLADAVSRPARPN